MTSGVARHGSFALKRSPRYAKHTVRQLIDINGRLRANGLPVPQIVYDDQASGLRMQWLEGLTLKQHLEALGPARTERDFERQAELYATALGVLRQLHAVAIDGPLPAPFDPFLHIDRRLSTSSQIQLSRGARMLALEIRRQVDLALPCTGLTSIIHGDFHAGQLIEDRPQGSWWLIDLDDAATGWPEADIANFCAHLATTQSITGLDVAQAVPIHLHLACSAYGIPVDSDRASVFAAAALLRRALKSAERGSQENWTMRILDAAALMSA